MTLAETITEAMRPMTPAEISALTDDLLAFHLREAVDIDPDSKEVEAMRTEIVGRWLLSVEPEGLI